ncbi:beta-defensin 116 [Otolemur garnettii]|uniref:beta-defensin 116 n=1 Tax=Otolemur garnettii TaxID=30611 RepID=UPI000C7EC1B5|nr:beta-defensin 116 [Otolemur garnettii]
MAFSFHRHSPPFPGNTSVMKPCFMTIAIFLILVQKTPGDLFRSQNGKWNPCELYDAKCRFNCRRYEIQHLNCPTGQKCCLKFSGKKLSYNNGKN